MNQIFVSTAVSLMMLSAAVVAQTTTLSQPVGADTFVSSGQPDSNFGSQGGMEIAVATAAQPRTELALMRFDTAPLLASFDATYGQGNWTVTGVSLSLFSNFATAGQQPNNASFNKIAAGGFEFDLLGNNNWDEMGITWNTLPGILPGNGNANTLTPLGAFFWSAAGQRSSTWTLNSDPGLLAKIYTGGQVTLFGQPTAGSTVGYLFNTFPSNPGSLNVTVQAVPEPSTLALIASVTGITICWNFRRKKSQA